MTARVAQAAAVPFRLTTGDVEICLITTNSGCWGVPKGTVDPGDTPAITALKEAEEEAGLLGHLLGDARGTYTYSKFDSDFSVDVFLMQVERALDYWEESKLRERKWVSKAQALKILADHPGVDVMAAAILDIPPAR